MKKLKDKLPKDSDSGLPIIFLNASALKRSSCIRRFALSLIPEEYKENTSIYAIYGQAFHKFLAEFYKGTDPNEAKRQGHKLFDENRIGFNINGNHLTNEFLEEVMNMYLMEYYNDYYKPYNLMGEYLIEKTFALEANHLLPKGANYKLVLYGTFDLICQTKDGVILVDHKTTSMYNKEQFLKSYLTSTQLMFYRYCLELYSLDCLKGLPCQINGIFLGKSANKTTFIRSELINYEKSRMEVFKNLLQLRVKELTEAFESDNIPLPEGFISNSCSYCSLYDQCSNDLL